MIEPILLKAPASPRPLARTCVGYISPVYSYDKVNAKLKESLEIVIKVIKLNLNSTRQQLNPPIK